MTGKEVFAVAISMLIGKPSENPELEGYSLLWLNLLLEESLPYENSIRRAEGEEELGQSPKLTSLIEEIPYHDAIAKVALPYGIAAFCWVDDDRMNESELFRAKYLSALQDAAKLTEEPIADCYGKGGEDA